MQSVLNLIYITFKVCPVSQSNVPNIIMQRYHNFLTRYPPAGSLRNSANSSICWPTIVAFEMSFTQQHFSLFSYLGLMQFMLLCLYYKYTKSVTDMLHNVLLLKQTQIFHLQLTTDTIPSSATCKIKHIWIYKKSESGISNIQHLLATFFFLNFIYLHKYKITNSLIRARTLH